MTRLAMSIVALLAFGCSKPTEENCRKAISNMQMLMGTDNLRDADGVESEVRRCKGGSSRKAVDCAIKAQNLDDLRKCDFYKVPENAKGIGGTPAGSAAGSATGPTGSATGSAAGSATGPAAGSATGSAGSAGDPAAGSAAGSAAATDSATTGSAAAGSAGAEAAGSAAGSGTGSAATHGPGKQ